MGLQARLMSQALRKITAITSKTGTTVIFINQLRMKIGIMFGNPETTTGGRALKFYSSVRLDIRQKDKILKDGQIIGHVRKVKVAKNKMAPPFKEATFDMIYPLGIDKESSIIDAALELGVVEKKGSWYSYEDTQLGQGKEASSEFLREDKKVKAKIVKEVKAKVK
jgi:recombination protein RecA